MAPCGPVVGGRPARHPTGINRPDVASAVIAVGVVIGDGVTRAAASIPMAVGLFVLLFLSAVGYVVVNAMSPSASRR